MTDGDAIPNLLEIEALRVGFGERDAIHEVVKGVSFRVAPGKTVALVGESGSGKSVISQAVMGLLHRKGHVLGGRITFRDPLAPTKPIEISALGRDSPDMHRLRGGRIGMIFQEPMSSLSPVHTIGDQIGEAFLLHCKGDPRPARSVVIEMLDRVGFKAPDRAFSQYPFELSGGLRQRAMLAMALVCRPALLIADEPTTALDVTIQAQVLGLMRELQRDIGMAILLITHDLGVVANMADEIVVVYHGQVMESGTTEDLFQQPQHPYLRSLFRALPRFDMGKDERLQPLRDIAVPRSASAKTQPAKTLPAKTLPAEASGEGPERPLLEVRHLSKIYPGRGGGWFGDTGLPVRAVDDVSFSIMPGECLGLVGESGCGKTTVSKIITRALTATSGEILFQKNDQTIDVGALEGAGLRAFRPHMQMVFQDPASSLSPRMTVRSILREPLDIHNVGTEAERDHQVTSLMEAVGLDPRFLNRYPHSFSGGQRQRIGIARALALSPDLMVCDEPVSALDVSVQAQVLNLLKDLAADRGLAYLFISHNLAVVKYMAHRIAVMANGRIVEIAPAEALFEQPGHFYTRTLRDAVPFADLARRMDFAALPSTAASDMSQWPAAFRDHGQPNDLVYRELGAGHFVLANRNADPREFRP